MDRLLYVAMNGASRALQSQSAISHNIANASTPGFKAALLRASADEVVGDGLHTRVNAATAGAAFDGATGPLRTTGQPLDIALHDDHWLTVQGLDGAPAYTRAGNLRLNELGQLLTSSGHAVMGNGGPVALPPASTISIGGDGAISMIPQGQEKAAPVDIDQLRVVTLPADQLTRGPHGLFRPAPGVEAPAAVGEVLTAGAVEESNVSVATALVDMIAQQRLFETQVKLMNKADENAQRTAELMRMR